ncbi:DUF2523 family protein [Dyella sp. LX-1]|uniref:DUF2523 family protein n=1 Tax=Dyella sp. LX-1 TaxID=2838831 RepID=UPI001BE01C2B|nr:DUF2523 family protein [Dyella sp. LX-1]MBT2119859.1 DUF2523 domain-containing protein [Dyella sp. LX-1]MBT2119870.1 DUF2523 domain-containing protein [Dyella sp. LX-1]
MPIFIAWIGEMLLSVVGQMVISALVSVGIGFAASKAVSGVIDTIGISQMLGSAGPLVDYLGWFGVDQAVTIVLSAWAGRKITDAATAHIVAKRGK